MLTNAPVNHVGMAVVLDDMPPLMWHAELGKGLRDVWTDSHHRGVQLHDLREAVVQWCGRYHQRAWLRQLDAPVTPAQENAVLKTIARLDGTPFPPTAALAARWARGRFRQPGRRGGDVLRRGGRGDVHRDGPARRRPADQRLRPGQLLVRRAARPARRAPGSGAEISVRV